MHKQQGAANNLPKRNRWDEWVEVCELFNTAANDGMISQMFNRSTRPTGLLKNVQVCVSHLVRPEEEWLLKDWSKFFQPLQVKFLRKKKKKKKKA